MKLSALLTALPAQQLTGSWDERQLSGLAYDSRQVLPGNLFIAIPGTVVDGHNYIKQALERGAVAVLAQHVVEVPADIALIVTEDSRRALAALSAAWYDYPDRQLRLIGVTGTNGKTTTVNLIDYLLSQAGHKCGLIGTVGSRAGDKPLPALVSAGTTPESLELYQLLHTMQEEGCDYAVMEASSHALEQGRVSACNFVGAVFTNLTQDHLDYHLTMDAYCQAKTLLFSSLDTQAANSWGVINLDDPYAERFRAACRCRLLSYGRNPAADLRLLGSSASMSGMEFSLSYAGTIYQVCLPLMGLFNIYNALAAIAAALAEGLEMRDIIRWLATAPQVPGRFELIQSGQDFAVVVDYAHTPDGLENLLNAARDLRPRRLITMFGCGGDRDNAKRPLMGRISGRLSDVTIITSDNPRTEDAGAIIDMIEAGIRPVGNNYIVEPDRRAAIALAIGMAGKNDIVLLAGKGHEDYQIIGTVKHHFDDREQAREVLSARLNK